MLKATPPQSASLVTDDLPCVASKSKRRKIRDRNAAIRKALDNTCKFLKNAPFIKPHNVKMHHTQPNQLEEPLKAFDRKVDMIISYVDALWKIVSASLAVRPLAAESLLEGLGIEQASDRTFNWNISAKEFKCNGEREALKSESCSPSQTDTEVVGLQGGYLPTAKVSTTTGTYPLVPLHHVALLQDCRIATLNRILQVMMDSPRITGRWRVCYTIRWTCRTCSRMRLTTRAWTRSASRA